MCLPSFIQKIGYAVANNLCINYDKLLMEQILIFNEVVVTQGHSLTLTLSNAFFLREYLKLNLF